MNKTITKANNKVELLKDFDPRLASTLDHLKRLDNNHSSLRPEQLLAMANNDIVGSNKATEKYVMYSFKITLEENHIHTRQYLSDIDYIAPITSFINSNDVLVYADLAQERAITELDVFNVLSSLLNYKITLY